LRNIDIFTKLRIFCGEVILHIFAKSEKDNRRFLPHWKKENKIFLIYQEIQSGAVAKSYIRKGFLIYEKMHNFPIYEEAVIVIYALQLLPLNFLIYEEILFSFLSVNECSAYIPRKKEGARNVCLLLFHLWRFPLVHTKYFITICSRNLCEKKLSLDIFSR